MSAIRGLTAISLAWIFTILYWSVFGLFTLLTCRKFSHQLIPAMACHWGRVLMIVLGVELDLEGGEYLADEKPRVVIINHQSGLDIVWGSTLIPPGAFAIAKVELCYLPIINLILWATKSVFVDRSNHEQAIKALENVARVIKEEKRSLFVAPEGTRTPDGEIGEFKKGAFHIAMDAGVPIYPLVSHGGFQMMEKGALYPRRGTIKARCLPPIDTSKWNLEHLDEHIEVVRAAMVTTLEQLRAG